MEPSGVILFVTMGHRGNGAYYTGSKPPISTSAHFMADHSNESTVRGACPHDCPDTCALLTTVVEGRAVRVAGNPSHRHTDGALCTKVSRYTERT